MVLMELAEILTLTSTMVAIIGVTGLKVLANSSLELLDKIQSIRESHIQEFKGDPCIILAMEPAEMSMLYPMKVVLLHEELQENSIFYNL